MKKGNYQIMPTFKLKETHISENFTSRTGRWPMSLLVEEIGPEGEKLQSNCHFHSRHWIKYVFYNLLTYSTILGSIFHCISTTATIRLLPNTPSQSQPKPGPTFWCRRARAETTSSLPYKKTLLKILERQLFYQLQKEKKFKPN